MSNKNDIYTSNTQVAKNTIVLYLRMLFVLCVNLYVSRAVLQNLGVVDYGIYNLVGGIVVLFSYLNSALSLSCNRFYCYEIKNGIDRLKVVFNTSLIIQIIFSILLLLIAETIGLYLVNNKLIIPEDRLYAANIVYQLSVITTILSIVRVPYDSAIMSHERMGMYAILSVIDVIMKFLLASILCIIKSDILIFYGLGISIIAIVNFLIRIVYCKKTFAEIRFSISFDKLLFKNIFEFTGWNILGATAGISVSQGLNVLMNLFFGPIVNAARGIAVQIEGAVNQFVTSINTAVNPQIVKRYSVGDLSGMMNLVFFSSKISFILLLLVSFPIIVDTQFILRLWLGIVPDNAVIFTRLELLYILSLSAVHSINMCSQATGNIKPFQIAEAVILILNIPIAYLMYRQGFPVYSAMISLVVLSLFTFFVKLILLKKTFQFPLAAYFKQVIFRLIIILFSAIVIYFVCRSFPIDNFIGFILKAAIYYLLLIVLCLFIGLNKTDRQRVYNFARELIIRLRK